MSDIFISYTTTNRPQARLLAAKLQQQGWTVWWDRTIPPGQNFDQVIEEALAAARSVIVIWSASSVASQWVRAEAGEGLKHHILIPIRIEAIDPPLVFRQLQAADLSDWAGEEDHSQYQQLIQAITELIGLGAPSEDELPEPTSQSYIPNDPAGIDAEPPAAPAANAPTVRTTGAFRKRSPGTPPASSPPAPV